MTLPHTPDDDRQTGPSDDTAPTSTDPQTGRDPDDGEKVRSPEEIARRKRIGRILLVLAIIGLIYGAYSFISYQLVGRYIQETDDAYIRADSVTIGSKLSGYIRSISVRDNQMVERGALLAEIDPTDYSNRVADANAQIAVARANRDASQASIGEARTGISQAEAALASARRELAYLNSQVALYRPLIATGAEPKQTYDQYVANRDKAAEDVAGKQAAVEQSRSQLASAEAQLEQSNAQVQSAEVKKQSSQNDLGYSRIAAPIAGKVASSALRVGQFVQPGQRLLSIVPTQDIYVEANFKETQIGLMRAGQPVIMRVDALSGVEFHGKVESVTPGTGATFSLIPPQNATGNFTKIVQRVPVRIHIDAGPEARQVLVPGLSVRVEIDTRSAKPMREKIKQEQEGGAAR
ncbi:MAG TPA: HlyD family secretion protein [Sphingobium sp.]|uniref:HlyD family secretion protein n=1 Tax=Sphingobium sp. TaxID=1912891 RepID=UPI002ED4B45D